MTQKITVLILISFFSLLTTPLFSQNRSSFGIFGAGQMNQHSADFRSFPGVPSCCPNYNSGSGIGFTSAFLGRFPLNESLRTEVRLGLTQLNGLLTRQENVIVSGGVQGIFEHRVDASLHSLYIEPLISFPILNNIYAFTGGRIGFFLDPIFSQKEVILQPSSGTFPNGTRTQNVFENIPIPNTNTLNASIIVGIHKDFSLNQESTLLLVPEISYSHNITSVVTSFPWNVHQFRVGASLLWSPIDTPEPIQRKEERKIIDTITVEVIPALAGFVIGNEKIVESTIENEAGSITYRDMIRTDTIKKAIVKTIDTPTSTISQTPSKPNTSLSATISASGLYPDGKESVTINIEVEEFSSVLMTPLLPYVFFNEGESNLDSRYRSLNHNQTERFKEEYVNSPDKLPTYYHLLNIVGKRLRINPYATITLIGCNADIGIEKGNTKLSQMRAETIKNYLIEAWGIPETRITIQSRNLPLQHANTQTKDGAQENRRVEIISNDPSITAPLITRDTLRTVTPPSVRFRPKTFGESQIEQWKLEARQNSRLLKVFNGTGAIPGILDWNIDEERGTHPTTEAPVVYKLTVIDEKGAKVETGSEIEVEQLTIHKKRIERIADKEIDRFGLILFDVRSSEINSDNARIINLIKSYIRPTSTVSVKGLTDRLGNPAQNQTLAEGRAKSTAKALEIPESSQNVRGVGNASLYAPELPEGRLYTRTVEIIVETPIIE